MDYYQEPHRHPVIGLYPPAKHAPVPDSQVGRTRNYETSARRMTSSLYQTVAKINELLQLSRGVLSPITQEEADACRIAGMSTLELADRGKGRLNLHGLPPGCAFNYTYIARAIFGANYYNGSYTQADLDAFIKALQDGDSQGFLGIGQSLNTLPVPGGTGTDYLVHSQLGADANIKFEIETVNGKPFIIFKGAGLKGEDLWVGYSVFSEIIIPQSLVMIDETEFTDYLEKLRVSAERRALIKKYGPAAATVFAGIAGLALLTGGVILSKRFNYKKNAIRQTAKELEKLVITGVEARLPRHITGSKRQREILRRAAMRCARTIVDSGEVITPENLAQTADSIIGERFVNNWNKISN